MRATCVDMTYEPDVDQIAAIASGLGERIRDDDPRAMFDELVNLCRRHPVKAAQLLMCFAAWFDPFERARVLGDRAEAITARSVA